MSALEEELILSKVKAQEVLEHITNVVTFLSLVFPEAVTSAPGCNSGFLRFLEYRESDILFKEQI